MNVKRYLNNYLIVFYVTCFVIVYSVYRSLCIITTHISLTYRRRILYESARVEPNQTKIGDQSTGAI